RSRLKMIQECAGGPGSTRCLLGTSFKYDEGGNDSYQANAGFTADPLATLDMLPTGGTSGVLLGDFNGDGKTDIIRWSDTPSQNKLYLSKGDGSFLPASNFTITAQNLFKSDGCYYAIAADFNGDGITDILRIMRATSTTDTSC